MPQAWHRRHAMALASQLPDNHDDAVQVVQAILELLDTFMIPDTDEPVKPANVLPFATG